MALRSRKTRATGNVLVLFLTKLKEKLSRASFFNKSVDRVLVKLFQDDHSFVIMGKKDTCYIIHIRAVA